MHLAVCDDNIADRKQTERLLSRESDRRKADSGVLYIDSYGSQSSFLYAPMIYDGIFIDLAEEGSDAIQVANRVREQGYDVPIVFCCSCINYQSSANVPGNCYFLDKPLRVNELSAVIDRLLLQKSGEAKRIEFRDGNETFYLIPEDITYAQMNGRLVSMYLTDGQVRSTQLSFDNFCSNVGGFHLFFLVNRKTVANIMHVRSLNGFLLLMEDGTKLRVSPHEMNYVKKVVTQLLNES